jgi:hypothetical protein
LSHALPQINITNTVPLTHLDADEIRAVLLEYKLNSCDVSIRQPEATLEELIDVIEGNRVYMPALYVLNKIDAISIEELDLLYKIPMSVPISSSMWLNIDELIEVRPSLLLAVAVTPCCLTDSRPRCLATFARSVNVDRARPRPCLHQAAGSYARLQRAGRPQAVKVHGRELLCVAALCSTNHCLSPIFC